ncbi:MAG TPA: hypothetical protein VGO27_19855 [Candidatus Acidoferrum sp.]|jgi:hypothetical protein|nr:hypothetical protein [Candidatus Acidoferrum sp.]
MDFREATDQLFHQIDHDTLAEELGVSVASIRQARLKPDSMAHRAPPKQWERAVLALAERQIEHYKKLAQKLRRESFHPTSETAATTKARGRPITA